MGHFYKKIAVSLIWNESLLTVFLLENSDLGINNSQSLHLSRSLITPASLPRSVTVLHSFEDYLASHLLLYSDSFSNY